MTFSQKQWEYKAFKLGVSEWAKQSLEAKTIPHSLLHMPGLEIQSHMLITIPPKESTNNCNLLFPSHAISLPAKLLLLHNWKARSPEAIQQLLFINKFLRPPLKHDKSSAFWCTWSIIFILRLVTNKQLYQSLHKQRQEKVTQPF